MKKRTVLFFGVLIILAACDYREVETPRVEPTAETEIVDELTHQEDEDKAVTMKWITLNEVDDLENRHEFNLGTGGTRHLMITTNGPVSELRLITIEHVEDHSFRETNNLFNLDVLASHQPLVLHGYAHVGTLPAWAITFIDDAGKRRQYLFQESQNDGVLHYRAFDLVEDNTTASPNGEVNVPAGMHLVVEGDTLFSIAQANGVQVEELQDWNRLGDSTHLPLGRFMVVDINLASPPRAVSPYRPLIIRGYEDVTYPHPFGNEDSHVVFLFDGGTTGSTLVIGINEMVRHLAFVPVLFIERETGWYGFDFLVDTPFSQAPELLEHQYLMIHNWTDTAGTFFNQGLVFTDRDGNERKFVFGINNQNGGVAFNEVVDGFPMMQ